MPKHNSAKGPSQRQLRVAENVRHALIQVLQRGEVSDPVLDKAVISVSEVRMTPDLKIATCFISPLGEQDVRTIVKSLAVNAKGLRHALTPHLRGMKYMPSFRFLADESFDNYAKIDALLRDPVVSRDVMAEDQEAAQDD
jgi:ribosome-binding factor A